MPLGYNQEWADATTVFRAAMSASKPALHDISARRQTLDSMLASIAAIGPPIPSSMIVKKYPFNSYDNTPLSIHQLAPKSHSDESLQPALFYIHGGGMIHGIATDTYPFLVHYVQECGVQVLVVEFRLAPEHPHPVPIEDCFAGLKWLQAHSTALNIDPARIALWGHSSGVGMAAALALMARDRGLEPKIAKQILMAPMLDCRTARMAVDKHIEPFLVAWSWEDNLTGWSAYLGRDWLEE